MLVTALVLMGCSRTVTVVIDTSCDAFKPISSSSTGDTPATLGQIIEHNAVYDQLCIEKDANEESPDQDP